MDSKGVKLFYKYVSHLGKRVTAYLNVPQKPKTVHISMTDFCNLKCVHCDIYKRRNRTEGSALRWKPVISKLRGWLGPFTLKLSGGEPFTVKDTIELIGWAARRDIKVGVSTNGTLLTKNMVTKLVDSGIQEVIISLDSLDEKMQDSLRGKKGTLNKVKKGIQNLTAVKHDIFVILATVVMKDNLHELVQIAKWARKTGLYTVNYQPLQQNFGQEYNSEWFKTNKYFPNNAIKINNCLDDLIEFKKKDWVVANSISQIQAMKHYLCNPLAFNKYNCGAGITDIGIDATGDFKLCFNLQPLGNVFISHPADMFYGFKAYKRRKEIQKCKRGCSLLNCHIDFSD